MFPHFINRYDDLEKWVKSDLYDHIKKFNMEIKYTSVKYNVRSFTALVVPVPPFTDTIYCLKTCPRLE